MYESILSDFPESAEARAAVCIRHLVIAQKGPSDPAYPMALKESITEFMHHTVV